MKLYFIHAAKCCTNYGCRREGNHATGSGRQSYFFNDAFDSRFEVTTLRYFHYTDKLLKCLHEVLCCQCILSQNITRLLLASRRHDNAHTYGRLRNFAQMELTRLSPRIIDYISSSRKCIRRRKSPRAAACRRRRLHFRR